MELKEEGRLLVEVQVGKLVDGGNGGSVKQFRSVFVRVCRHTREHGYAYHDEQQRSFGVETVAYRATGMPDWITAMVQLTASAKVENPQTAEEVASGIPTKRMLSSHIIPSVPSDPMSKFLRS